MECSEKPVFYNYTGQELAQIRIMPPDEAVRKLVKKHWDTLAKPLDGMGSFESITAQIGAILGTEVIDIHKKGDNLPIRQLSIDFAKYRMTGVCALYDVHTCLFKAHAGSVLLFHAQEWSVHNRIVRCERCHNLGYKSIIIDISARFLHNLGSLHDYRQVKIVDMEYIAPISLTQPLRQGRLSRTTLSVYHKQKPSVVFLRLLHASQYIV